LGASPTVLGWGEHHSFLGSGYGMAGGWHKPAVHQRNIEAGEPKEGKYEP